MATLILAQLQFMECFIEDLLNLNLNREGIQRTRVKEAFKLKDALDFVMTMFKPKADLKKLSLNYCLNQGNSNNNGHQYCLSTIDSTIPPVELIGDERSLK